MRGKSVVISYYLDAETSSVSSVFIARGYLRSIVIHFIIHQQNRISCVVRLWPMRAAVPQKWLELVTFSDSDTVLVPKFLNPVSSEIFDLCEISDLLLFFNYFASLN